MRTHRGWRIAAASVILLALAGIVAALVPAYLRNREFQGSLREVVRLHHSASDDALRSAVVERAARLGLPVRQDNVDVTRSGGRVRVDVKYQVPVDVAVSSVNLHFHPVARN